MSNVKSTKEVVQEVKGKFTKDICDKIIKTCEYLVVPVAGVAAIWGLDISVYSAAFFGMVASIFAFVKLFLKD